MAKVVCLFTCAISAAAATTVTPLSLPMIPVLFWLFSSRTSTQSLFLSAVCASHCFVLFLLLLHFLWDLPLHFLLLFFFFFFSTSTGAKCDNTIIITCLIAFIAVSFLEFSSLSDEALCIMPLFCCLPLYFSLFIFFFSISSSSSDGDLSEFVIMLQSNSRLSLRFLLGFVLLTHLPFHFSNSSSSFRAVSSL